MTPLRIITTNDGSHSLYHEGLDETYHSRHGARRESQHVFIQHGLQHWCGKNAKPCLRPDKSGFGGQDHVSIFEVGFGTGLNAWLTHQFAASHGVHVDYVTIEAYPLPYEVWSQLNYAQPPDDVFAALHQAPWNTPVLIDEAFELTKLRRMLEEGPLPGQGFDVVYYDAFAPGKQPALWTFDVLEKVCKLLTPSGVFVTYCAKGQLKRDLRALGLVTETLPGPPGKKEMVRATRM